MPLNSNLLSDRLNAYRDGEELPETKQQHLDETIKREYQPQDSLLTSFISLITNSLMVFLKAASYGFAAKTIFSTDWKFIAFLAVGFSFDLLTNVILDIFTTKRK